MTRVVEASTSTSCHSAVAALALLFGAAGVDRAVELVVRKFALDVALRSRKLPGVDQARFLRQCRGMSVVDDFRADGEITPCKHTVQALERTSQLAPSDIAEYSPDFPAAVSMPLWSSASATTAVPATALPTRRVLAPHPGATATPPPSVGAAVPARTGSQGDAPGHPVRDAAAGRRRPPSSARRARRDAGRADLHHSGP